MGSLANATTDDLLDEFIRNNAGTAAHPVGTASMSSRNASYGVVDPDLKVKGVAGLRIVDASVLVRLTIFLFSVVFFSDVEQPFVPSGHTQAAVYAFAERAADLIKAEWS